MTTIGSQPALRQRQEYLLRILQVKKIPFTSYDLASDEAAKRLWKRKAPLDKQQLPGILVGGCFPGTFSEFEDAVESDSLVSFLRLNESWAADEEESAPPAQPVGVPGAVAPLQMTPDRLRKKILAQPPESSSQCEKIPVNKQENTFDVSTELEGYGLQGVRVTDEELRDLVAELGLDKDDAGDLVKGLSGTLETESKESTEISDAPGEPQSRNESNPEEKSDP